MFDVLEANKSYFSVISLFRGLTVAVKGARGLIKKHKTCIKSAKAFY